MMFFDTDHSMYYWKRGLPMAKSIKHLGTVRSLTAGVLDELTCRINKIDLHCKLFEVD